MNLFRMLLLAAAVYVIVRVLRTAMRRIERQPPPGRPGATASPPAYEPMARCGRCGAHVPQASLSEAGHCQRCQA